MSNEMKKPDQDVPPAVLSILGAMVQQALARCDQLGIAWVAPFNAPKEQGASRPGTLGNLARVSAPRK